MEEFVKKQELKNEIISSFPFQMTLYFNILLFPFHLMIMCISMYFRFDLFTLTYRVIVFSACIVHVFSEAVRLSLGFFGNLMESMSALSGFFITSTLIQIPITLFLIFNSSSRKLPIEYLFLGIFFIFNILEIIFSISTLKKVAMREMIKYAQKIVENEMNRQVEVDFKELSAPDPNKPSIFSNEMQQLIGEMDRKKEDKSEKEDLDLD